MGLARTLFRGTNAVLGRVGLELLPRGLDFESRLESPWALARMFRQLADEIEAWLARQTLFDAEPFDAEKAIADLYHGYIASPFRTRGGGSRFNNLVWLYAVARAYRPTVMVDSGTYFGASAWALRQASPAPLYSFDIDLSRLKKRVDATYVEADWAGFQFEEDLGRSLCYFDDHVDQARRLLEARAAHFSLAVFDDDLPLTACAGMAHGGFAFPKVEFVLDDELRKQASLEWSEGGRRRSWPVDVDYLDRARSAVAATERLPDTSFLTGIQQLPYRLVRLAP